MTESMLRRGGLRLVIVSTGAALYVAPILKPQFAALTFLASVPWLICILSPSFLSRERSPIWFLCLVYLIGLLSLNWLGNLNIAAWLISPLFYILLFLPTFYVTRELRSAWPAFPLTIIWGLSLTGTEWFRIWASPGEVPFCQLGASLVHFPKLIQVVDVAGSSALSTIAAVTTGFTADVVVYLSSVKRAQGHVKLSLSTGVVIAVFAMTLWYGYRKDQETTFSAGPRLEVVQTNMPGWRDEASSRLKLQRAIYLTLSNNPPADVDLVVWPENSVVPSSNDNVLSQNGEVDAVSTLAQNIATPILFDGPFDIHNHSEWHRAALVQPDGSITEYMKQLLVPWSEYAPFEPTLRSVSAAAADSYLAFIQSRNPYFTPTRIKEDRSLTVFNYGGRSGQQVVFGALICYEILNPRLVNRWYARLGKDDQRHFFLVNPVNEILLGKSVHAQALTFCRLRAVEGRVTVIRAANNGISAAIDPNGRVYDLLSDSATNSPIDVAGVFFPRVILDSRTGTIYTRFGDWWPITCLLSSLTLLLLGKVRKWWPRLMKSA